MNAGDRPGEWEAVVTGRRSLCGRALELELTRPGGFDFTAGQHIRVRVGRAERDYTLVTAPAQERLALCVREVPGPGLSAALARLEPGTRVAFTGPRGHFVHRPSQRPVVLVATGTGIAPFVAMVRAGLRGFTLLHGARDEQGLYYAEELAAAARIHVGCLTGPAVARPAPCADPARSRALVRPAGQAGGPGVREIFAGRVTVYLRTALAPRDYDFYLCGRGEMIRDAMEIIDESYPGSLVFYESFF